LQLYYRFPRNHYKKQFCSENCTYHYVNGGTNEIKDVDFSFFDKKDGNNTGNDDSQKEK